MSTYATWRVRDDEEAHDPACPRMAPGDALRNGIRVGILTEGGLCHVDNDRPCECDALGAPVVYRGSHVVPSITDLRGGTVLVCAIPNHITRDGRDDGSEGRHDWVRLSVFSEPARHDPSGHQEEGGSACVLLDRRQVVALWNTLTEWIDAEER